nr:immunoglobulin light chain junction region [Macaca mulatta]MOY08223.1 immunoglobulin light chain junction region [Macaca mulatta]
DYFCLAWNYNLSPWVF